MIYENNMQSGINVTSVSYRKVGLFNGVFYFFWEHVFSLSK